MRRLVDNKLVDEFLLDQAASKTRTRLNQQVVYMQQRELVQYSLQIKAPEFTGNFYQDGPGVDQLFTFLIIAACDHGGSR